MVNNMTAFVFETIEIFIFGIHKMNHVVKFSMIHFFYFISIFLFCKQCLYFFHDRAMLCQKRYQVKYKLVLSTVLMNILGCTLR